DLDLALGLLVLDLLEQCLDVLALERGRVGRLEAAAARLRLGDRVDARRAAVAGREGVVAAADRQTEEHQGDEKEHQRLTAEARRAPRPVRARDCSSGRAPRNSGA